MVFHVFAACALMPVAGHPYDLASLTGTSGAWLRWGIPLFYHWKFGFDLSILAVGAQGLSFVLQHLGMSGAAALAAAWKLPLVLADLLVAVTLVDLGKRMNARRPGLIPVLWLLSPVPLWVSAGHGQIESLTVLSVVLSLDLLLRRQSLLAGLVAGLGIGIEYLPALVAIVVIFWLYVSVIGRKESWRFAAGCVAALAFCFGPLLSTPIGRTSLLAGLGSSASAASHPGHLQIASRIGSSLWALFDLSPGPFWLAAALVTAGGLLVALARKARSAPSAIDCGRLGILAAGGLLLCVTLFDPGALPQFSVIVSGGLCLVGICLDLSAAVIILGPLLQLVAGLLFVYGGSFQSYWYDMWVTTGVSGWPFPQSLAAANGAARLGVLVIALGLLFAFSQALRAKVPARLSTIVARSSIAIGVLGSVFFATWSLQSAYWQGVGSHGPATLADFPLITAFQPGTVSRSPGNSLITFSRQEVLAARESTVSPSLVLRVTARPFFAQTKAEAAKFGRGATQTLTLARWAHERVQVRSLRVSVLLGNPAWRSRSGALSKVPAIVIRGFHLDTPTDRSAVRDRRSPAVRRVVTYSSDTTWVAPGWAVVTYDIPASMVSPRGRLTLRLRVQHDASDEVAWNGSRHVRWVLVSLGSGTATVTIDGKRWNNVVTLPNPRPSLWLRHVEATSIQGIPLNPRAGVHVTRVLLGGKRGAIVNGGFEWPSPGVLDHTIDGPLLGGLGVINMIVLLGGALLLGRRTARATHLLHARLGRGGSEEEAWRRGYESGDMTPDALYFRRAQPRFPASAAE